MLLGQQGNMVPVESAATNPLHRARLYFQIPLGILWTPPSVGKQAVQYDDMVCVCVPPSAGRLSSGPG